MPTRRSPWRPLLRTVPATCLSLLSWPQESRPPCPVMWLGATKLWARPHWSARSQRSARETKRCARESGAAEHTCCRRALARHFRIVLLPLLQDVNHKLQRVVRLRLQELGRDVLEDNAQIALVDPLHCVCLCSPGVFPVLCAGSGSGTLGSAARAGRRRALALTTRPTQLGPRDGGTRARGVRTPCALGAHTLPTHRGPQRGASPHASHAAQAQAHLPSAAGSAGRRPSSTAGRLPSAARPTDQWVLRSARMAGSWNLPVSRFQCGGKQQERGHWGCWKGRRR